MPRLRSVRGSLAVLGAVGAALAAALGARHSWPYLGDNRAHLTAAEAVNAAAVHEHLSVALFDRLQARLHPTDRWWLDVPEGNAWGLGHRGDVYRAYAVFWFLPAVPANSRSDATVVLKVSRAP